MKSFLSLVSLIFVFSAAAAEWKCVEAKAKKYPNEMMVSFQDQVGTSQYYEVYTITPLNEKVSDFLSALGDGEKKKVCLKGTQRYFGSYANELFFAYDIK